MLGTCSFGILGLVKMEGVQKAFEELSNSQKLHMINPKCEIFLLSVKVFLKFSSTFTLTF